MVVAPGYRISSSGQALLELQNLRLLLSWLLWGWDLAKRILSAFQVTPSQIHVYKGLAIAFCGQVLLYPIHTHILVWLIKCTDKVSSCSRIFKAFNYHLSRFPWGLPGPSPDVYPLLCFIFLLSAYCHVTPVLFPSSYIYFLSAPSYRKA